MSGFMCASIAKAFKQILHHIDIAVAKVEEDLKKSRNSQQEEARKQELKSLKDLITSMEAITRQIQHYRLVINRNKDKESTVKEWVKKFNGRLNELDEFLRQASRIAQQCTLPTYHGDPMSKRMTDLTSTIGQHLKSMYGFVDKGRSEEILTNARHIITPATAWQTVTATSPLSSGWQSVGDFLAPSTSSATISQAARFATSATARMKLIDETRIVGQSEALAKLEKLVIAEEDAKFIGVHGKGGSGKTLLLSTFFNSEKVRNYGFLIWLTVSQSPSFPSLRNKLWTQMAMQNNVDVVKNINEQHVEIWIAKQNNVDVIRNTEEKQVKTWLIERQQSSSSRFVFFLDDVWERNTEKLLDELGILGHTNSKFIVSSRDRKALENMRIVEIRDLNGHASWELFAHHAFQSNDRNLPAMEEGKLVCHMCQGLPLAIKVVGRAMAGNTHPKQWRWALQRLSNAESVYGYNCGLRFSLDALGNENINLQCCFLLVAAASFEDQILFSRHVILLWAGERLLSGKVDGYDPFEMGWIYLNHLADRCLIEPMVRDYDGHVVCFRIHDDLRGLAIRIAENEENFYRRVGSDLTELNGNECSECTRILVSQKGLRSLHKSIRAQQFCSLLMSENKDLTKIPRTVTESMISLKVLDLSETSVQSLPDNFGLLKQLVSLRLWGMPIKTLPSSFTNLESLEILDLSFSSIIELPSGLDMLKSLRYLGLTQCKDLQYLPRSISQLKSLQYFHMIDCCSLWRKHETWHKVASIQDLGSLTQLKRLEIQNNGETVNEKTFENMTQMDTLRLTLTKMKSLPSNMGKMSNIKRLALRSSQLVSMDKKMYDFHNLSCLILCKCDMLVELPDLHNLQRLRQLEIIACRKLRKFPENFGDTGAFSLLEIFSLVRLEKLETLSEIKEGAMPLLKVFTIMECPLLKILPESYLNLKTLKTIRIYSCPMMVANCKEDKEAIKVLKMSIEDTEEIKKWYFQLYAKHRSWFYGDFWCNELFLFLGGLDTLL